MAKLKRTPDLSRLQSDGIIIIKLTKGYEAVIDATDADLADFQWYAAGQVERNNVYAARTKPGTKNKPIRMHVLVMSRIIKRALNKGEEVDHVDGNHFNNRRSNLRLATRTENMTNQKLHYNSTSGFKGVTRLRYRWVAQIQIQGKKRHLGVFDTPEEAHQAYCEAGRKYFGEFFRPE